MIAYQSCIEEKHRNSIQKHCYAMQGTYTYVTYTIGRNRHGGDNDIDYSTSDENIALRIVNVKYNE